MERRTLIAGAGKSGLSAARLLAGAGEAVFLYDGGGFGGFAALYAGGADNLSAGAVNLSGSADRGAGSANNLSGGADRAAGAGNLSGGEADLLQLWGAEIVPRGREYDYIDLSNLVVASPGIPPENPVLRYAEARGKKVISELELGFTACKAPVMAFTGTNGKTTATSLAAHLLAAGGLPHAAGGNIGVPFCDFAADLPAGAWAVLEVSSFMLERVFTFRPRIAALLNLTPDHLDRHKTMEAYAALKRRIFENQTPQDYAVLNADDPAVRRAAADLCARVYLFSTREAVNGAYLAGKTIYFGGHAVCPSAAFKLAGAHNLSNALAAVTAAKLAGAADGAIERGLRTFAAVPHRLQLVKEAGGIRYYNDSKATNADGALQAVRALSGFTALILGGSDKGCGYDDLFAALPPRVHCLLMGATAGKMEAAARRAGYRAYTRCSDLRGAAAEAVRRCKEAGGGNVLLSPAAASFDAYQNFEQRGQAFTEIVLHET